MAIGRFIMETINVDQAVFASSNRGAIHGYQLVSQSAGIDRVCAQALLRWAPTQLPPDVPGRWALNYFGICDAAVAVTRTLRGGPEYSGRGGRQIVTLMLVLSNAQFALYQCNPLAVARTAMTMGVLKLPLQWSGSQMPPAVLPRCPLVDPALRQDDDLPDHLRPLLDQLTDRILDARRVAVIGLLDPLAVVNRLLSRLPEAARRGFSFTTGLLPATCRPFQAHFLASADAAMQHMLQRQDIDCMDTAQSGKDQVRASGGSVPVSGRRYVTAANRA